MNRIERTERDWRREKSRNREWNGCKKHTDDLNRFGTVHRFVRWTWWINNGGIELKRTRRGRRGAEDTWWTTGTVTRPRRRYRIAHWRKSKRPRAERASVGIASEALNHISNKEGDVATKITHTLELKTVKLVLKQGAWFICFYNYDSVLLWFSVFLLIINDFWFGKILDGVGGSGGVALAFSVLSWRSTKRQTWFLGATCDVAWPVATFERAPRVGTAATGWWLDT